MSKKEQTTTPAFQWGTIGDIATLSQDQLPEDTGTEIIAPETVDALHGTKTKKKATNTPKKVADGDRYEYPLIPTAAKAPASKKADVLPMHKPSGYKKCADTHPALPIVVGDKTYYVYGGSCITPIINDMDIFIGFDHGMRRTSRQFPWHKGTEFLFPITDMHAPSDLKEFMAFMDWLIPEILAGKKVFMGCIGGHGRTGTVMAALVTLMSQHKDSITYVRENYCTRTVESAEQVDWLNKYFGITKASPTKAHGHPSFHGGASPNRKNWDSYLSDLDKECNGPGKSNNTLALSRDSIVPVPSKGTIWGGNKIKDLS